MIYFCQATCWFRANIQPLIIRPDHIWSRNPSIFFVHRPHDGSVIVFVLWHNLNAAGSEWERSSVRELRVTVGEWGTETVHKAHILVTSSEREIKDASHKERERQETTSTSAQHYKRKKERRQLRGTPQSRQSKRRLHCSNTHWRSAGQNKKKKGKKIACWTNNEGCYQMNK